MKKIYYCDMDGVLVNFADRALARINKALSNIHLPQLPEIEKITKQIHSMIGHREVVISDIMPCGEITVNPILDLMYLLIDGDSNFWATLPWMPNGKRLWQAIKNRNPIILTSPYDEASKIGKREWIFKNLREKDRPLPQIIFESKKFIYANKNSLLIDDMPFNCVDWVNANGTVILWEDQRAASLLQLIR